MTLADLEIIQQLLDMAAQRGMDLTHVAFGTIALSFARPAPEPVTQWAAPVRPDVTATDAVMTGGASYGTTTIQSRPRMDHTHSSLWTNGVPPAFPVRPTRKDS